ncbi:MAG: winged helix-turn-helix domain-containing protein [Candidatus Margulisiibacteriota bacterium]|nr:winged helix-turn-helix domain-containing protein [Candidatus Margulisiibacteriota bacterium]
MLKPILDNLIKERILLAILIRKEVYARDIASIFNAYLLSVQNQLKKLEKGGVVVSQKKGKTRLYSFNPRYPFLKELKNLLSRSLQFMPKAEKEKYYTPRLRPRRAGKPL